MPKFHFSLHNFFDTNGKIYVKSKQFELLTVENILEIGYHVIDALESLHSIGYVHNDIKPDNIMFNPQLIDNQVHLRNIKLIDFGFATKYIESKTGSHIAKKELSEFRGNIEFSSLNHMNFESQSRRDDLISLFYLLICVLNDFKYPLNSECDLEIYKESELSDVDKFQSIMKMK